VIISELAKFGVVTGLEWPMAVKLREQKARRSLRKAMACKKAWMMFDRNASKSSCESSFRGVLGHLYTEAVKVKRASEGLLSD
jgi:hypothetical protein